MTVLRERERHREREREREGGWRESAEREGRSVCSDRQRVCGEIERSVREKRKRGRDRVCAE